MVQFERPEEALTVQTKDPEKPKSKDEKTKKTEGKDETDLSEEDKKLQSDLQMLMNRLTEPNQSLYRPALESMRTIIRSSTTSMTSVPKPLKYMIPHYPKMKEVYEHISEDGTKKLCADIISVLAMCSDESGDQDCVQYRLKGAAEDIGDWGHEYVRHLCKGVIEEWRKCETGEEEGKDEQLRQKLLGLVREIVKYNVRHNAEVEACDLLIEIDQLSILLEKSFSEGLDYGRVCLYLFSCVPYLPYPENQTLIKCAADIYLQFERYFEALRCAVMLNDTEMIQKIFSECPDRLVQKQMAILLGRQQIFLELDDEKLFEFNSNTHLHAHFLSLCRELDIMAPKSPEDIYKSHLEQRQYQPQTTDTARQNLASTFVNGFVNCGFGTDSILERDEKSAAEWYQKNKDYGTFSAAASLGLIHRWDVDNGLTKCDQFLYGTNDFVQAGTLLAIGIVFSGIQDPVDPACALLQEKLQDPKATVTRIGATLGLGLAYANSKRNTVIVGDSCVVSELRRALNDTNPLATAEVKGLAALSLGLILVGTSNDEVALELLTYLMEGGVDFKDPSTRFIALAIALIYLGSQERSEVMVDAVKALPEPFGSMTSTLVEVCAYAGTGNVLKIQSLLHICSEHYEPEIKRDQKKDNSKKQNTTPLDITAPPPAAQTAAEQTAAEAAKQEAVADLSTKQAVAALGIGLIAMGEPIGSQMSMRMFGHLTRYGEPAIRRAVPLAMALTSVSNPQLTVMETLAKYSRDNDTDTARNAIFALGMIGAGTNNARLVTLLRQLASYHYKDQQTMMLIRVAQGLIHLGKGTMTMNPFHSDRQLMCPAAVAALFTTCFSFLDAERTILNRQHYLLYVLVVAIQPRMMLTLVEDEEDTDGEMERRLVQKPIQVRVGQAVDVVAQAGQPRTITGFQTHTTPVLLAYGERAELATDDYDALTPCLEGLVILKKKPAEKDEKANK